MWSSILLTIVQAKTLFEAAGFSDINAVSRDHA